MTPQFTETVASSMRLKLGGSSRCIAFSTPPYFGAGAAAHAGPSAAGNHEIEAEDAARMPASAMQTIQRSEVRVRDLINVPPLREQSDAAGARDRRSGPSRGTGFPHVVNQPLSSIVGTGS